MRKTDTLMTYEQWSRVHKRKIKKSVKRKLSVFVQWLLFFILMVGFPFGMVAHWVIIGY